MLLETKRYIIRNFKIEDIYGLYSILRDQEVMKYIEKEFTIEDTEKFLLENALIENPLVFAIVNKDDYELIGQLIFHLYDKNSYEIGWIFDKKYWNKRFASEMTKELIKYSKKKNIYSLIIECDPKQKASIKIAKKYGFSLIKDDELLVYEHVL